MPFTDSQEGQTHSFNDGCGEPEHNLTIQEKIDAFARNIQAGEIGAHATIKKELLELCREFALSVKPERVNHENCFCGGPDAFCYPNGYNFALKEWEENILNKPL